MMKYNDIINLYSSDIYSLYSKELSNEKWGSKEIAHEYLSKYYLTENEYLKKWKPIQNIIFQNQDIGLPKIVFKEEYSMLAIRGGILFEKEDFEALQKCIKAMGDRNLIIIQNDFGAVVKKPLLKMKYPIDITWDELMSGNFISTVLFEMFSNEYFVFSESANWGKYSANEYDYPLDIIGFKKNIKKFLLNNSSNSGKN